jgi:hypothetical protein
MKIIPERVTVIPDAQRNELTVIMDGFRLTLSSEEARTLSYALMQGAKQLPDGVAARPFIAGPSTIAPHGSATASAAHETPTSKATEGGVVRSMQA